MSNLFQEFIFFLFLLLFQLEKVINYIQKTFLNAISRVSSIVESAMEEGLGRFKLNKCVPIILRQKEIYTTKKNVCVLLYMFFWNFSQKKNTVRITHLQNQFYISFSLNWVWCVRSVSSFTYSQGMCRREWLVLWGSRWQWVGMGTK